MKRPVSVLLYSHDPQWLEFRRSLLHKGKVNVFSAQTLSEVRQIASGLRFDILILCHTLSASECEKALAIVHQAQPLAKYLMPACSDIPVSSWRRPMGAVFDGPIALLASVQSLAQGPGTALGN